MKKVVTSLANTNPEKKYFKNEDISIKNYIEKRQNLQREIINYLDNSQIEENFQSILNTIECQDITKDKNDLTDLLHIIVNILNNHYRLPGFFQKIEKILTLIKESIQQNYSNMEIFDFFESNKRILLFLLQEELLTFDDNIVKKIIIKGDFYPQYFATEIKPFLEKKWFQKNFNYLAEQIQKELPDDFNENREIGENENEISKLIRKDLVKEFIVYVNKNNIELNSTIEQSIYETNPLLLTNRQQKTKLIEYATFFGSIQIFNYLRLNGVKLTKSLWKFAIHGQNAEIIQILEENKDEIPNYEDCFIESIKCHNYDISMYFINNFLDSQQLNSEKFVSLFLKYYNFLFIQDDFINESSFHLLCKYDYYILVKLLISNENIDINKIYKFDCSISDNDAYNDMAKLWYYETNYNDYIKEEKVPLYLAIENKNYEIAKLLLNDNIDVNIVNKSSFSLKRPINDDCYFFVKEEESLLHLAIRKENTEIAKLLLNNYNNINVNRIYKYDEFGHDASDQAITLIEESPLHLAIKLGNVEVVKLLLMNQTIDVNKVYKINNVLSNSVDGDQWKEIAPLSLAFVMTNNPISHLRFPPHLQYPPLHYFTYNDVFISYNISNYIEIIKLLLMNNKTDVKKHDIIMQTKDWAFAIRRLWNYNVNNYTEYFNDNKKKKLYEIYEPNILVKMAKSLKNKEIIDLLSQRNTKND